MHMTEEVIRNTPTGVGKTPSQGTGRGPCKKHPHGRGEDCENFYSIRLALETPPRAWGRQRAVVVPLPRIRNTPTGVGKTGLCRHQTGRLQKHPHGRGEDVVLALAKLLG